MGGTAKTHHRTLISPSQSTSWGYYAISALAFSLCLDRRFGVWFLVASVIPALFSFRLREFRQAGVWVPGLFFLIHLLGLFYTTHRSEGFLDVQQKLAFVLFPLLLPMLRAFSSERKEMLVRFYVAGLFLAACISWWVALYHFWDESYLRLHDMAPDDAPYTNYFFSSRLSHFMHPGYFAAQLIFGVWLLHRDMQRHPVAGQGRSALYFLQLFLLATAVFMLSKSSVVLLLIFLIPVSFSKNRNFKSRLRVIYLVSVLVVVAGLIFLLPSIRGSFMHAWEVWQHPEKISPESTEESSELRILAWKTATEIFLENPFTGVGTGDVNPALWEAYEKKGFSGPSKKHLNAHSQYLQTAAALGIPGLISLLLLPSFAFYRGLVRRHSGWLVLGFMILWLPLTECWFEQQHGMFFFLFWWVYFFADERTELSIPEQPNFVRP